MLITACSNPILLFLYTSLIDGECVTGLFEFENIHAPDIASRYWFDSAGLYVFPTIEFECNGSIQGVRGIANFYTGRYYRRTLFLNLNLWRLNQNKYVPTISRNVTFSPESITSGDESATAPLYFSMARSYTFSINLTDASIDVMAGDILGIYLPPETTYESSTIINHIPIGGTDDFIISSVFALPRCWSPTLGRASCSPLPLLLYRIRGPLLSLNFVPALVPTGKLVLHVFDIRTSVHTYYDIMFVMFYMYLCFSMKIDSVPDLYIIIPVVCTHMHIVHCTTFIL